MRLDELRKLAEAAVAADDGYERAMFCIQIDDMLSPECVLRMLAVIVAAKAMRPWAEGEAAERYDAALAALLESDQ